MFHAELQLDHALKGGCNFIFILAASGPLFYSERK
jgi:hypothetical protein